MSIKYKLEIIESEDGNFQCTGFNWGGPYVWIIDSKTRNFKSLIELLEWLKKNYK